ncbi:ABC transporter permease [Reyranella sp.]|jgi:NitT/TauT family transport system permease protein|uniref:ABC transporter permease n=1 Tax=Reyranella sp. TaxID=1929291 RepID=UPI002F95DF6E
MTRPLLVRLVEDYWGVVLLLCAWQLWVVISRFNVIVMPTPTAVLRDLLSHPDVYLDNVGVTLAVAAFGLVAGMAVGTGLAVAAWFSAITAGLLNPITVLFSSVPVVALIPVIARLLGYDTSTVLAIVVIITFFPSFVFASSGLRSAPPGSEDLFRVLGASRLDLLRHLALPAAMPNLAIAFRLASAHAILAAMVAEFLMGTSGLGYLFAKTKSDFQTEQAFGASAVATAISAAAFLLAGRVERWARERYS